MIPSTVGFLDKDFEIEEQPSLTYKMQMDSKMVRGYADGLEAVRGHLQDYHDGTLSVHHVQLELWDRAQ